MFHRSVGSISKSSHKYMKNKDPIDEETFMLSSSIFHVGSVGLMVEENSKAPIRKQVRGGGMRFERDMSAGCGCGFRIFVGVLVHVWLVGAVAYAYQEVPMTDGGTLTGTVKLQGKRPVPRGFNPKDHGMIRSVAR